MSHRLVIRYRGAGAALSWLSVDALGRVLQGPSSGRAPDSAALEGADEIVVLVPAAEVLLARAELPVRQREQLERALPFALEEQLVEPVEAMHFAYRIEAEGGQAVAAVRRTLLEQWLDDLGARGVYPDRMLADAAALPWAPGSLTVLVEGEGTLIRAERSEASSLETDELGTWLGLAAAERGPGVRVVLHDEAGRVGSLPPALAVDRINPAPPALAWLAPGAFAPDGVDLLSGKYAARHRGQPVRQLWRMAALFLAAVVVLAFAQAAAEQWRLHRRLVLLEQEMAALYRQSFPGAKQAPGSSAQMRAELERASTGRGSGGALALLKRLAPILTASTQYTVKALEYRSGTLDLVIIADSVATLDSVRERVLSLGLGANLSAVSAGELGTEGKLRVEAPR